MRVRSLGTVGAAARGILITTGTNATPIVATITAGHRQNDGRSHRHRRRDRAHRHERRLDARLGLGHDLQAAGLARQRHIRRHGGRRGAVRCHAVPGGQRLRGAHRPAIGRGIGGNARDRGRRPAESRTTRSLATPIRPAHTPRGSPPRFAPTRWRSRRRPRARTCSSR